MYRIIKDLIPILHTLQQEYFINQFYKYVQYSLIILFNTNFIYYITTLQECLNNFYIYVQNNLKYYLAPIVHIQQEYLNQFYNYVQYS